VTHQREIKRQLRSRESLKEGEYDLFRRLSGSGPPYPDKVVGVFNTLGDALEMLESPQVVVKKKAFKVASR